MIALAGMTSTKGTAVIGRTGPHMRWPRRAIILAAVVLASPSAWASPLDADDCKSLKSDYEKLVESGAKSDMEKGADWAAKANLKPDRLKEIARLITVEEQLSFRCGQIVTAPPMMSDMPEERETRTNAAGKRLSRIPLPEKKPKTPGLAAKEK